MTTKFNHDIAIVWNGIECKKWALKIDNYYYYLEHTTPEELINMFNEIIITHKSIIYNDISIEKLSSTKLDKIYNNFRNVSYNCLFCNQIRPLYKVTTYNKTKPSNDFFICRQHLKELTTYLEDMINTGTCRMTSFNKFTTTIEK